MKKLPIGIQSFSKLREENCVYVDKTEHIYRLICGGNYYFLSRPRRFGKSLLVSTMEEVFRGNKALFEGLYIYDKIDWTEHPVIRLDFAGRGHHSPEALRNSLGDFIDNIALANQISLNNTELPDRFMELIIRLHETSGQQVVVLVDEYDKPIVDHLQDAALAKANRDVLKNFYEVLKAADAHLRFVFLTGVSKFSKVSVFSGLNNLVDITLEIPFATICGYTQAELEDSFAANINELAAQHHVSKNEALNSIKDWYNGYSWDGATSVYNPFSTLLLFRNNQFDNFWFATGTPTFLVNLIKERNDVKSLLEPGSFDSMGFDSFDPDTIDTKQLLFQTGYLTVKSIAKSRFSETMMYALGVPNEEVRRSLMSYLVGSYANYPVPETVPMRNRMLQQLFDGDVRAFERSMQEMFARIPYQLHIPREAYYHSLLLLWCNLLGLEVQAEIPTDKGRIDAVWTWEERVVIAELKYSESETTDALLDKAMAQIKDTRYHERYAGTDRRIALLAIAFAGKEIACRMEEMK